jgi:hypothetical protein
MDHALLTAAHPGSSAVAALTPAQVGHLERRQAEAETVCY